MHQSLDNVNPTTGLLNGSFGIGTFESDGRAFPGIVRPNGEGVEISDHFADTHAIFDDWKRAFDRLVDIAASTSPTFEFGRVRPLPPLKRPNFYGAGANYKAHSAQMLTNNKAYQHNRLPGESTEDFYNRNYAMMERRSREGIPFMFTLLHSTLIGAHDEVMIPVLGNDMEFELELGVVIGQGGIRHATHEQAQAMIAGYTIVNDLGTVDVFRRTDIPWGYDWISKNQPRSKPFGPFIVPAQFVSPAEDMRIKLSVAGIKMHDWHVTDMIFDPARLVAYASERLDVQAGDLLITGSPPGNGSHHGRFLQPGDTMKSEITYLGRQRNVIYKEAAPDHPLTFGHWKKD